MPRPTARGRQASNKEARLLAAALRLFAERGVDGTTMRDVAEAVGITKATLYHYFSGKDALFAAIFRRAHSDGEAVRARLRGAGSLRERLEQVGADYLAVMRRPPHLALILARHSLGPATDETSRRVKQLFADHIQQRIEAVTEAIETEAAERRVRVEAGLLASHFVHALTNYWLVESFVAERMPSPEQSQTYLAHLADVCVAPLVRPAPRRSRPGGAAPQIVPPR